ncbi:FAST kinase domain-containing protein 4 [Microplitis mediator]|uniref:FAST kinase domain-containing protein 4 n=1 Tax=Microplitis mediator TaxID=375433 RepID=UPI002553AC9F|nr:FAST kinase domain-containing protein 4 [Microplitis mediator]XP_057339050.1 FAST kinase domain-containing protein 4 [Microplitis mediator]
MTMLKLVGFLRNGPSKLGPRSTSCWCMSKHKVMSIACSSTSTANKPAPNETKPIKDKSKFPMVKLVFNALSVNEISDDKFKENVTSATTLDELLRVSELAHGNEQLTLITSTLKQWVQEDKVTRKDIESDPRFHQLRSRIKRSVDTWGRKDSARASKEAAARREHLQKMIAGNVDYNDEISKLSVKEAVDAWTGLTAKGSREKPLLRALASHIGNNHKELNIKQSADVLYGMAKLNFPDDVLLKKICREIIKSVDQVSNSPIIGSIITSLGMLRYRNDALMDELSQWAVKNKDTIRTQDVCSFLMTLATIGYKPINSDAFFNELVYSLKEIDMIRPSEWLDIVWALTTLNHVSSEHISSVLNDKFINKLGDRDQEVPLVKKHKLLNINATARYLIKHYTGPQLPENSSIFDAPISKTKDKEIFVRAIKDTLATLFPSRDHFREDIDDGMGFLLDLDFFMDKKLSPIPIDQVSNKENVMRIAIVANSYQNYTRGECMLIGPVRLHYRLLQAQQCRILDISYVDFHTEDILLKRVTYINDRIKSIVK